MTRDLKRSVTIAGHRTSVALEPEFWAALKEIAASRGSSLAGLVAEIDAARVTAREPGGNLSRALRLFVVRHYRDAANARPAISQSRP